ncbi:hypothetical protein JOE11_004330 [Robbsia andropogonis]|nr:hypothetical protein [Robbsia andropogonis]
MPSTAMRRGMTRCGTRFTPAGCKLGRFATCLAKGWLALSPGSWC